MGQGDSSELYSLKIILPDRDDITTFVKSDIIIGSGDECNIPLKDLNLSPIHLKFRFRNGILGVIIQGEDGPTKLGRQKLKSGKMYILDAGDKILVNKIKIIVGLQTQEEVDLPTIPNIPLPTESIDKNSIKSKESNQEASKETEDSTKAQLEDVLEDDKYEYIEEEVVYFDKTEIKEKESNNSKNSINEVKINFITKFTNFLKNKFRKEKSKVAPGAVNFKKGVSVEVRSTPGILVRFYSFLSEIIFAFGLTQIIKRNFPDTIQQMITDSQDLIQPKVLLINKYIFSTLKNNDISFEKIDHIENSIHYFLGLDVFWGLFIVFFAFGVLSHFLFKTSFSLFLMGVRDDTNFLTGRLLAPLRFTIGLITSPFLIFDFPILLSKKSFKELITFSMLYTKYKLFRILGFLIGIPIICFMLFMYPIFLNLDYFLVDIETIPAFKISAPLEKKNYKPINITLPSWGISGQSSIDENWILLPDIIKSKGRWTTVLKIIDINKNENLIIEKRPPVKLKALKALKENPFLFLHYSELMLFFNKAAQYPLLSRDLVTIAKDSMALTVTSIPGFIFEHGPDLAPYIQLNQEISTIIGIKRPDIIEEYLFLKKNWINFSEAQNNYFLSFDEDQLTTFHFSGKRSFNMDRVALTILFANSKPILSDKRIPLIEMNDNHALLAFELFNLKVRAKELTRSNIQKVIYHYMQASSLAIEMKNEFLQKELISTLHNLDISLSRIQKTIKASLIEELRLGLNRTKKALEEQDIEFFKLNQVKNSINEQPEPKEIPL